MALARLLVICLLDVRRGGAWLHLQQIVVLRVCHGAGTLFALAAPGCTLVIGTLGLNLVLQGAEVDVDPLAKLLVPDPLLAPASHGLRSVDEPPAYLGYATGRAADGEGRALHEAGAEALEDAEAACLVACDCRSHEIPHARNHAGAGRFESSAESIQRVLRPRLRQDLLDCLLRRLSVHGVLLRHLAGASCGQGCAVRRAGRGARRRKRRAGLPRRWLRWRRLQRLRSPGLRLRPGSCFGLGGRLLGLGGRLGGGLRGRGRHVAGQVRHDRQPHHREVAQHRAQPRAAGALGRHLLVLDKLGGQV
mmetsp:Transcript_108447/g.317266  ORF Transcript_108447/g.317266 Transcript_108447/m.317266 type:complete len:306 (-) Transcript_108447:398-1315(-)